jgi:hypothetical protein
VGAAEPPGVMYTIGGTVTGLNAGAGVSLLDNGASALVVSTNGAFVFQESVAKGGAYAATVGTQPTGEVCVVSGGSGTDVTANVTTIFVNCGPATYTVGGTLSGLSAAQQV